MTSLSALEKRIKRHVVGPVRKFFVITAPGLEKLCLEELMQLPRSCAEAFIVPGGIEFKGRLHDCYLANLQLCMANRILMRIGHFKATNFPKLQQKTASIPWELYLFKGCTFKIYVSSRNSRLYHRDAVAERVQKAIAKRLDHYGRKAQHDNTIKDLQQIFVRIVDDECMVSIDSSGELLHKRGMKSYHTSAPIRETIAAEILRLASFNETEPLVDPMCGSGTFSLEAAMKIKKIPAGWFREFAFMAWPSFRPWRWQYIRKQCEALFVNTAKPQVFASDQDAHECAALRQCVERYNLSAVVRVMCKDFFHLNPKELTDQNGLVVLNPPYGLRIGPARQIEEFFISICNRLQEVYKGWKLALIAPDQTLLQKLVRRGMTQYQLYHGGLRVILVVGRIEEL